MITINLNDLKEKFRLIWQNGQTWTFSTDGTVSVSGIPLPPVDDESVLAYNKTKEFLKLAGVNQKLQQIATTFYHCVLGKTATWENLRKALQIEIGEVSEAYVQLVRDGNFDDLKGVVKAMDEALKANGLPGVV